MRFDDSLLGEFHRASKGVTAEAGSGADLSRKIYASYQRFRELIADWGDIAGRVFLKLASDTLFHPDPRPRRTVQEPLEMETGQLIIRLPADLCRKSRHGAGIAPFQHRKSLEIVSGRSVFELRRWQRLESADRLRSAPQDEVTHRPAAESLKRRRSPVRPLEKH